MSTQNPGLIPVPDPQGPAGPAAAGPEGGTPWPPVPPTGRTGFSFTGPGGLLADLVVLPVVAAASALLGLVVGVVWRYTAPAILGVIQGGYAYYAEPEGKSFIGQDGRFAIYAACAGLLLGVLAYFLFQHRGSLGAALGLFGGGVGAGYLASWFGTWLGPGRGNLQATVQAAHGSGTFDLPMQLRSTGAIWLWPAVAVGVYFFLTLLFGPDDPPREPEDGEPGSVVLPDGTVLPDGATRPDGAVPPNPLPPNPLPPSAAPRTAAPPQEGTEHPPNDAIPAV